VEREEGLTVRADDIELIETRVQLLGDL